MLSLVSRCCVALATLALTSHAVGGEYTVTQSGKSFSTAELQVQVGDTVHFTNQDPFFHNVFSLSDIKSFDLGSYPKGDSKAVQFDKAGEVEVECAIHPQMYMVVKVEE